MYLLDTDILSNLLKRAPSSVLITKLASIPQAQQYTTSITLGELLYGAYRIRDKSEALLERIGRTLLQNLPVLPFDRAAASHYGELRAELERTGKPVGEADLRIGSIALARGLTVVTGNVRHFQRIPNLTVENWLADQT